MSGQVRTRVEYRVVGIEAPYGKRFELDPVDLLEARRQAEQARHEGDSRVRIETRTVTESAWTALPSPDQEGS